MRIGIDARMLGSGFGLARYIQQLVRHLQDVDSKNEYVLFLKQNNWNSVVEYDQREKGQYGQVTPQQSEAIFLQKNFTKVLADIPWYSWQEQIKFKKIIEQEKVDLMHFPHWNVPLFYNYPFVVTIHDLIMYHYPRPEATTLGPIKFWLKDQIHRLIVRHAVKKAKQVIVTSEFTKEDVHQTLGVEKEKMVVTYQAPFEIIKSIPTGHPPSGKVGSRKVLDKYKIDKSFVLYVGAAYPHKNLKSLVEAWQIFNQEYNKEYQLVFVGREDYFYKKLKASISNFQFPITFIDFIPDDELTKLYKKASLYVFPSLYEGFGLPSLEAMAHDLPVVSSNRSCLPEVLGEAALYFDPDNYEQMAEVINLALTDEDVRLELKEKGRENLKRFSWEKLAKDTLDIYQS